MVDGGGSDGDDAPIGDLFGRLLDQGKAYGRAELTLARAIGEAKAQELKGPALLLAGALLFVIAAVVVLCVTIALALATLIGPLAGGLVATLVALGIAGILAWLAKRQLGKRS